MLPKLSVAGDLSYREREKKKYSPQANKRRDNQNKLM